MATEELIVLLDARTAKLDAKLKTTEKRLDGLEEKTKKADTSLAGLSKTAGVAAGAAIKLGAAALAAGSLITAMTLTSASSRRELELLSVQARTTAADFQALSFATNQYGINAEQIGDISKDITDRIGEFAAAGTGVFQDYADTMKLSKDEARAAAQEFEGLSSQEILGTMISRMEDAGVSGDKMLFVLESLGNDASKLIPLFANNSKELIELKNRFNDVNDSLQITGTQAEALKDVSQTFGLLKSSAGNAATAISATLAPVLDDFFNDIIAVVPDATQTIIDFINSFIDAENISSRAGVLQQISEQNESIKQTNEDMINQGPRMKGVLDVRLKREKQRLKELQAQLEVLTLQEQKLEDVKRLGQGEIGGETGEGVSEGEGDGIGTGDEIQAIADRFKLEETLLAEKLVRELEMVGENNDLKLELQDEFEDNLRAIRKKREKQQDKDDKKEESVEKKRYQGKLGQVQGFSKAASIINSAFLGDNEILAKGLIVADTAAAVMKSLSINPYDYANVAVLVATGLAQLSSVGSSNPASSGGGGGQPPAPASRQQDFQQETTGLELSNATEGGSTETVIRFATDTGDSLFDAFAEAMNKGQQEGRFK